MLWRTSPVGTELEGVVVDWLRQALGLPESFDGLITDTASTSSLIALAAAREAAGVDAAAAGLAGRRISGAARLCARPRRTRSIEKACMTLGSGAQSLVRVAADDAYAMRPDALAAAIAADRAAGRGRSRSSRRSARRRRRRSTRSRPIADIAAREGLWLHVDAAYAGAVAIAPRAARPVPRLGARRLDRRQPAQVAVHAARCVAPAHAPHAGPARRIQPRARIPADARSRDARSATTTSTRRSSGAGFGRSSCGSSSAGSAWRAFAGGSRATSSSRQAFAGWVGRRLRTGTPGARAVLDGLLPVAAGRARPARGPSSTTANTRSWTPSIGRARCSFRIRACDDRFTIRLAVGNLRTEPRHVERAWTLLREAAADR